MTGAKPLTVPLSGAQAPLPPGVVTATPQAGGAVHLTWPASPSTGVAGYEVDRRVSGGPWQTLDASAPAGGIVDQDGPRRPDRRLPRQRDHRGRPAARF